MQYRSNRMSRNRRINGRRINGRGLRSWGTKVQQWLNKNAPKILNTAKQAGSTALRIYQDPAVRGLADKYASPGAKRYMSKADTAIDVANILRGAATRGSGRRRVRMRRRGRGCCGGSLGNGLGMYGR